ncbi:hypothetical protein [Halorussus aquaticus]|uniref:CPBP family intramembrane metalloprotease n=1 Tax=Halorussus aquaticus TaxID=2953748 RepID=A0ABD5Q0X6_9EURY|nr:hypothetical protein [Halorussus aquaticus]
MTNRPSARSAADAPPASPTPGPPESPDGYGDPTEFSYPGLWLSLGSLVLFVLAVTGFGRLMHALRGGTPVEFTVGPVGIGVVAALSVATIVVHELVRGAVYHLLGYRVKYGLALNVGAAYAAASS